MQLREYQAQAISAILHTGAPFPSMIVIFNKNQ